MGINLNFKKFKITKPKKTKRKENNYDDEREKY